MEDVKQGIMASKIAAHAGDIAKGVRGARDGRPHGRRPQKLDWEAQWACAMDPETAKRIRQERKPGARRLLLHVRQVLRCAQHEQKALAGEHIDIL